MPPNTVESERLFFKAEPIFDSQKNRLDPECLKMLVFFFFNRNLSNSFFIYF